MILDKLREKNLLNNAPSFLWGNVHYLARVGSVSFGISQDTSDEDVVGIVIPPKKILFPETHAGVIHGFGKQPEQFLSYQQHHILDKDEDKEYDITIYNIVKYLHLLYEGNPSLIESLFVHRKNILYTTPIGEFIRENRRKFLSKQMGVKLRAYSFSQLSKMESKNAVGKRKEGIEKHGYCCKFAGHSIRLLLEYEDILLNGDLDLEKHSQMLLSIRKGEWSLDQIKKFVMDKELELEKLAPNANLQASANEQEIKGILIRCLEMHYGDLNREIIKEDIYINALKKIREQLELVKI